MIILIEGVQRTGKSTLTAQLADDLNWPILKFNVPPDNAYEHFSENINRMWYGRSHFIIDRCHLSNWAYEGRLGGGVLDYVEWAKLDDQLRSLDTWIFLMVDDPFAIEERLRQRDKDDGANQLQRHDLYQLQQRFVEAMRMSQAKVKGQFALPQLIDSLPTNQYYQILEQILRKSNGED